MGLDEEARVPDDRGTATLGLLMQLAGSMFAALAAMITALRIFELRHGGRNEALWLFVVLGLSIARSLYQRTAGDQLLHGAVDHGGTERSPLTGLKRYIGLALLQSVVLAIVFVAKFEMSGTLAFGMFSGLAVWPSILLALLVSGRFAPLTDGIPVTEDKGFEGAAIVMTLLGVCGVIVTATALAVTLDLGPSQGREMLGVLALAVLVVRSVLHVHAGASGLRETSMDRAVTLANRYANFGVISAFCAGGALLLVSLSERFDIESVALASCVCWMLMIWPLIVRRFFSERHFADLAIAGDGQVHRRAPDAGITGLGWLLVAHAAMSLSLLLPQIAISHGASLPAGLNSVVALAWPFGERSLFWNCGLSVLELWAGYELVRMTHWSRHIATGCALVTLAVSLYIYWPVLSSYGWVHSTSVATLISFAPVAIHFAMPIATLVLLHRRLAPTARARFRSKRTG